MEHKYYVLRTNKSVKMVQTWNKVCCYCGEVVYPEDEKIRNEQPSTIQ